MNSCGKSKCWLGAGLAVGVLAAGLVSWYRWHRANQADAAIWAAGTDQVS